MITARVPNTVSVVIPAFNAALFIRGAIASCLAQTRKPLEILVIDDGSSDQTADIAGEFGEPVRVIRQRNRGEGGARNRGIDESQGEWVAFLDADDTWEPTKLEEQLAAASEGVIACHTSYRNVGVGDDGSSGEIHDVSSVSPDVRYALGYIAVHSPIMPSTLMVRREIDVRFPEWATASVDVMYCMELTKVPGRIVHVASPLVNYLRHPGCMSRQASFLFRAHDCMFRWLDENNDWLPIGVSAAIKQGHVDRLVSAAQRAKWCRDWKTFDLICQFLRPYSHYPNVKTMLSDSRYPRWVYFLRDKLRVRLK
jgi:glycosyltransferase involved in cell wall biosynthesis